MSRDKLKIFLFLFLGGCVIYIYHLNTIISDKKTQQRDGENAVKLSAERQAPVAQPPAAYLPRSPCKRADFPLNINMSEMEVEEAFISFLDKTHYDCKKPVRMGNEADGGWEVCVDPDFEIKPPCLIYSFGIGGDWTFDDHMAKTIGCKVFSFDPSMGVKSHQRSQNNTFFDAGLGGFVKSKGEAKGGKVHPFAMRSFGQNWELKTFAEWMKYLKHDKMIVDYLKFDIEGDEWPALEAMLVDGSLENVRQLGWEGHSSDGTEAFYPHATAIHTLENVYGFRKWYRSCHDCPGFAFKSKVKVGRMRSMCCDMVYVNSRFMTDPKCDE